MHKYLLNTGYCLRTYLLTFLGLDYRDVLLINVYLEVIEISILKIQSVIHQATVAVSTSNICTLPIIAIFVIGPPSHICCICRCIEILDCKS